MLSLSDRARVAIAGKGRIDEFYGNSRGGISPGVEGVHLLRRELVLPFAVQWPDMNADV